MLIEFEGEESDELLVLLLVAVSSIGLLVVEVVVVLEVVGVEVVVVVIVEVVEVEVVGVEVVVVVKQVLLSPLQTPQKSSLEPDQAIPSHPKQSFSPPQTPHRSHVKFVEGEGSFK